MGAAMKAMKAAKVMKAAKPMKVVKAMKAMKKISASLSKRRVFAGKAAKSTGGLTKAKAAKGKKSPWIAAVQAAKKALNLKGFVAIKKGSPLYVEAKALYTK